MCSYGGAQEQDGEFKSKSPVDSTEDKTLPHLPDAQDQAQFLSEKEPLMVVGAGDYRVNGVYIPAQESSNGNIVTYVYQDPNWHFKIIWKSEFCRWEIVEVSDVSTKTDHTLYFRTMTEGDSINVPPEDNWDPAKFSALPVPVLLSIMLRPGRSTKAVASVLRKGLTAVDLDDFDRNDDGCLEFEECKLLFQKLGISDVHFERAFQHIDINKDERISKEEFVRSHEYLTSMICEDKSLLETPISLDDILENSLAPELKTPLNDAVQTPKRRRKGTKKKKSGVGSQSKSNIQPKSPSKKKKKKRKGRVTPK